MSSEKQIKRLIEIELNVRNMDSSRASIDAVFKSLLNLTGTAAKNKENIEKLSKSLLQQADAFDKVRMSVETTGKSVNVAQKAIFSLHTTVNKLREGFSSLLGPVSQFAALTGAEMFGLAKGVHTLEYFNKELISGANSWYGYGVGAQSFEKRMISLSGSIRLTQKETLSLLKSFEQGFNFVSLNKAEQVFKNLQNAVGSNYEAMQSMQSVLQSVASKMPDLENSIARLNKEDRKRLTLQNELMLMNGEISLSESKRFQDYINGGRNISKLDEERINKAKSEIEVLQDIRKTFEEINKEIGANLMPTIKSIKDLIEKYKPIIMGWVQPVTTFAKWFTYATIGLGSLQIGSNTFLATWRSIALVVRGLKFADAFLGFGVGRTAASAGGGIARTLMSGGARAAGGAAVGGAESLGAGALAGGAARTVSVPLWAWLQSSAAGAAAGSVPSGAAASSGTVMSSSLMASLLPAATGTLGAFGGKRGFDYLYKKSTGRDADEGGSGVQFGRGASTVGGGVLGGIAGGAIVGAAGGPIGMAGGALVGAIIGVSKAIWDAYSFHRKELRKHMALVASFDSDWNKYNSNILKELQTNLGQATSLGGKGAGDIYKKSVDAQHSENELREYSLKRVQSGKSGDAVLDSKKGKALLQARDSALEALHTTIKEQIDEAEKSGEQSKMEYLQARYQYELAKESADAISGAKARKESVNEVEYQKVMKTFEESKVAAQKAKENFEKADANKKAQMVAETNYSTMRSLASTKAMINLTSGNVEGYAPDKVLEERKAKEWSQRGLTNTLDKGQQNSIASLGQSLPESAYSYQDNDVDKIDNAKKLVTQEIERLKALDESAETQQKITEQVAIQVKLHDMLFSASKKRADIEAEEDGRDKAKQGFLAAQKLLVESQNDVLQSRLGLLDSIAQSSQFTGKVNLAAVKQNIKAALADLDAAYKEETRRFEQETETIAKSRDSAIRAAQSGADVLKDKTGINVGISDDPANIAKVNEASKIAIKQAKTPEEQAKIAGAINDILQKGNNLRVSDNREQANNIKHAQELQIKEGQTYQIRLKINETYKTQEQYLSTLASKAEMQIELMNSIGTGLNASVEMRMQAVGAIEKQIALQEVEKKNLEDQYALAKLAHSPEEQLLGIKNAIAEKDNEITSNIIKQANLTKSVRDGYLSAISAMTAGSGIFTKLMVTQDKNLGSGMRSMKVMQSMSVGGFNQNKSSGILQSTSFSSAGMGMLNGPSEADRQSQLPDFYNQSGQYKNQIRNLNDNARDRMHAQSLRNKQEANALGQTPYLLGEKLQQGANKPLQPSPGAVAVQVSPQASINAAKMHAPALDPEQQLVEAVNSVQRAIEGMANYLQQQDLRSAIMSLKGGVSDLPKHAHGYQPAEYDGMMVKGRRDEGDRHLALLTGEEYVVTPSDMSKMAQAMGLSYSSLHTALKQKRTGDLSRMVKHSSGTTPEQGDYNTMFGVTGHNDINLGDNPSGMSELQHPSFAISPSMGVGVKHLISGGVNLASSLKDKITHSKMYQSLISNVVRAKKLLGFSSGYVPNSGNSISEIDEEIETNKKTLSEFSRRGAVDAKNYVPEGKRNLSDAAWALLKVDNNALTSSKPEYGYSRSSKETKANIEQHITSVRERLEKLNILKKQKMVESRLSAESTASGIVHAAAPYVTSGLGKLNDIKKFGSDLTGRLDRKKNEYGWAQDRKHIQNQTDSFVASMKEISKPSVHPTVAQQLRQSSGISYKDSMGRDVAVPRGPSSSPGTAFAKGPDGQTYNLKSSQAASHKILVNGKEWISPMRAPVAGSQPINTKALSKPIKDAMMSENKGAASHTFNLGGINVNFDQLPDIAGMIKQKTEAALAKHLGGDGNLTSSQQFSSYA